jgi:uncharacterized protein
MINLWQDITAWYQRYAPSILEDLGSGISEEELTELEQNIGFSLPEDYRESLKIYNGEFYVSDYQYISAELVYDRWSSMKELLEDGVFNDFKINYPEKKIIQNTWWNIGWIPFAEDSCGNKLCLDMNPGINGVKGQVIFWETGEGPIPSKYLSFRDWLEAYKNDLYHGKYEVDEAGYLEPK